MMMGFEYFGQLNNEKHCYLKILMNKYFENYFMNKISLPYFEYHCNWSTYQDEKVMSLMKTRLEFILPTTK